jgi:hypothetical protein
MLSSKNGTTNRGGGTSQELLTPSSAKSQTGDVGVDAAVSNRFMDIVSVVSNTICPVLESE